MPTAANDIAANGAETDNNLLGSTANIDDENVPLAATDESAVQDENDANLVTQTTGIADQQTPLSGQVCNNPCENTCCDRHYWWWVLAIIASITGKAAWDQKNLYDEQKREEKERKARNNYRNQRDDDLEGF